MNLRNIKVLIRLANSLDSKKLYKEADIIDDVIIRIATPIEEIYVGPSVGRLGEKNVSQTNNIRGFSRPEWFKSLEKLKTPIVLIFVDPNEYRKAREEGSPNQYWGHPAGVLPGFFNSVPAADFFQAFPMPDITNAYPINKNAFILLSESAPIEESNVSPETSPKYLGHDLVHSLDQAFSNPGTFSISYSPENILQGKITQILGECYDIIDEEGNVTEYRQLSPKNISEQNYFVELLFRDYFRPEAFYSTRGDWYADLIGKLYSEDLNLEDVWKGPSAELDLDVENIPDFIVSKKENMDKNLHNKKLRLKCDPRKIKQEIFSAFKFSKRIALEGPEKYIGRVVCLFKP